jgi:hypothetical protein
MDEILDEEPWAVKNVWLLRSPLAEFWLAITLSNSVESRILKSGEVIELRVNKSVPRPDKRKIEFCDLKKILKEHDGSGIVWWKNPARHNVSFVSIRLRDPSLVSGYDFPGGSPRVSMSQFHPSSSI